MAIKGLTDRNMSFPEIGQIRKGAPKTENAPGRDLQYFRITMTDEEEAAAQILREHYGDKPAELDILLPFNEIDRCWEAYYEAYTAGRMVARADGERYLYLADFITGEVKVQNGEPFRAFSPRDAIGEWHNSKTNLKEPILARPVGRLKVVLPILQRLVYLTLLTSSIHDIKNISEQLNAYRLLNDGQIVGIPFIVRRRPKKISVPFKGQRARMTKWLISIETDPKWVQAKMAQLGRAAIPGSTQVLLQAGLSDEESREWGIEPEPDDTNNHYDADVTDLGAADDTEEVEILDEVAEVEAAKEAKSSQEYWNLAYGELHLTMAQAHEHLGKHGGDFTQAYYAAKS